MKSQILNGPDSACDAFVGGMPKSRICHLFAWRDMVAHTVGHSPFYLVARDRGQMRGVLPLMHVRSRLFGNCSDWQGGKIFPIDLDSYQDREFRAVAANEKAPFEPLKFLKS